MMDTKFDLNERIEKYLNNQLNPKELELFNKEIELNENLKQEIKLEEDLKIIVQREDVLDLREKIHTASLLYKPKEKQTKIIHFNFKKSMLIAACITAAVIVSSLIFNNMFIENNTKNLFKTYYNSDISLNLNRSGSNGLAEALISYNQKNYQDAISIFNEILASDSSNIAVAFYAGVSYIETEDYNNAIKLFNHIIIDQNNLYIEHAEWFLALCYLKTGNKDKAIKEFEKISKDTINYHNIEAKEILKQISLK